MGAKSKQRKSFLYSDYGRLWRLVRSCGFTGLRYLLPWHFYLDFVEIPITTRCNLHCPDCANLMPCYENPYDIDSETVIRSIIKICECCDVCGQLRLLGGEPFLHPELKRFIAAIPEGKCRKISIPTNATIIPKDPELYEQLRNKKVVIVLGNYPSVAESQQKLLEKLQQEGVSYEISQSAVWINYGKAVRHERSKRELTSQFANCNLRSKSILNGTMYYCPRHAHGHDLGIMDISADEYVDILNNTAGENRRQVRKLMWRHKPVEACSFCLRGTEQAIALPRGK